MSGVKLFKRKDAKFDSMKPAKGRAGLARMIGPETAKMMGGGLAEFDGCDIAWTVLYDEFIVVLEGVFKLGVGDKVVEGHVGDVIWIPENTPIRYMGDKSVVFYALAPVDWKKRHGME